MLGAVLIFCVAGCSTSTTPTAEPSSAVTAPEPSPSVAPGTTLAESDFQATLRATGAKYLVLQVFAEACGPCMTEALRLSGRREAWEAEGVAILGLGMDETAEATRKFDQDLGGRIAYPLYHAPWFAKRYDVEATPTLFLYSANGVPLLRADPESADPDAFTVIEAELQRRLGD